MPRVAVDHCRRELVSGVRTPLDFVARAYSLHVQMPAGGYRRVGVREIEDLAALALLKIQLAWEGFVEDTFLRYLCGARSASGFQPTLLQARQRSVNNALQSLLAPRQDFLNWSVWNTENRATTHFDNGDPYVPAIAYVRGTLVEMATVRNRIAHASDYSANEFRGVVRARLGHVPRGMTPGRFLLREVPGPGGAAAIFRIIDDYGMKVIAASTLIVP